MERKRGELLLEGVSAVLSGRSVIQKRKREGERVETNEPRKETKETLSVLCRQKGAKWVVIVFNTDKDSMRREGDSVPYVGFRYTPPIFLQNRTCNTVRSLD